MALPRQKKKKDGTFTQGDAVTPVITQAELDAQAIYASAARINPNEAARIKANAANGNIMSAGVLTSLSSIGGNTGNDVTNTIASIDAQTREKRNADRQSKQAQLAKEDFNNSSKGQFWSGIKGLSRGIFTGISSYFEGIQAGARTAIPMGTQGAKAFVAGTVGVPTPKETANFDIASQTVAGQVIKAAITQKTLAPKVDMGEGFFASEDTGVGLAAREASMNTAKIAIKDSTGKVIGYRPVNMIGDAVATIVSGGHPDNQFGTVVSAVADLGASFVFDPTLSRAAELKRLKKAMDAARIKGALGEVATLENKIKIEEEAVAAAHETRKAFLVQDASMKYDSVAKAEEDFKLARSIRMGKNEEALKADKGVQLATQRLNDITAIKTEKDAALAAAKADYDAAFNAAKAPNRIATTERDLAAARKQLANEKELDATIGNRLSRAPELEKQVATLEERLIGLNKIAETGRVVSKEELATLKANLDKARFDAVDLSKEVKASMKQVKERERSAKITAKAKELAASEYIQANRKVKTAEQLLNDQTIAREAKLKAYADSLEKVSGVRDALGNVVVDYNKIAEFLTGGFGSMAVERLAQITDWRQIWRASGKRISAETAKVIANAKTKEEVLDALAPFIKRGEIKYGLMKPGLIERAGMNLEERTGKLLPAVRSLKGVGAAVATRMQEHGKIAAIFEGFTDGFAPQKKAIAYVKDAYNTKVRGGVMLNIHDTEAMLAAVDDFAAAVKLDKAVTDNLLEKISTGESASIRGYHASVGLMKAVQAQFGAKIPKRAQEAFDDAVQVFEAAREEMSSYWASRHINGAELKYIDVAGNKVVLPGPHLDSELLNSTIYLPPVGEFLKLMSKVEKYSVSAKTRNVADVLISDVWKKMQLVRPAFVIRNIAEEQLRVFGTGHISFFNHPGAALAMWLGAKEGPGWRKFLYTMDNYKHTIFGDTFTTGDDAADLANEVMAHGLKNSYTDMMALDVKGSFDDRSFRVLALKNVGAVGSGHKRFFDGVANQLRVLHSSEFARVVAGQTPKEIADSMAKGLSRQDAVVEYFFAGGGRKTLNEFAGSQAQDFRNFLNTREGLKQYLYTAKDDAGKDVSVMARIVELSGGNRSLMQLLAKGKTTVAGKEFKIPRAEDEAANSLLNFKSLKEGKKKLMDAQRVFARDIRDTFGNAGNWDGVLVNVPSRNLTALQKIDNNKFVDRFFEVATRLEKNSTFGPEFRQAYWDAINDIAGALDANAVAKLQGISDTSLRPLILRGANFGEKHPVLSALKTATGDGPISIEDAHRYADNYARMHVKDLFYNAQERRLIFHQLRLIGPFMNAWEDTIRKWSTVAIENPVQIYKMGKTLNWMTNPESSSLYQITDARDTYDPNQGFFFNDPDSGQRMFWVPFAGTVLGKLAGVATGNAYKGVPIQFAANPMSFNFALGAGSILPGVGPGVTIPISLLGTFNQSFVDNMPQGVKEWLFPFGRSDFSAGLQSAILPANWNRIAGGLMGIEATYSSSFKPIMSYIASGGNYNIDDPADQAELVRKTDLFARWFSVMQGVTGLFSPASLVKKGLAEDQNGDATTQVALYKDFQDLLTKNDNDYNKSMYDMLNLYGVNGLFAVISSSAGNGPSNWDSYKFVTSHPDVATKYADIWGFVYPGGGLSTDMYRWNLVSGSKKRLSPQELLDKANSIRYYAARDALIKQVDAGLMDQNQYSEASAALKTSFGGGPKGASDPNRFTRELSQIRTLIDDERFVDIPAVKGLRDYMYLRDIALKNLGKNGSQKLTGTNDAAVANRAWLAEQAVWILQDNPDFYKMFYEFFANELENK